MWDRSRRPGDGLKILTTDVNATILGTRDVPLDSKCSGFFTPSRGCMLSELTSVGNGRLV